jgi:hypothetical protein
MIMITGGDYTAYGHSMVMGGYGQGAPKKKKKGGEKRRTYLPTYRWIPHNAGFGFLDIARGPLGVFASLDRF